MGRMTIVLSRRMLAGVTWRGAASWTRLTTGMLSPRRSSSSSSHSALYVSDADSRHTAPVELNLDVEKKLSSPTALVRNLRLRGLKGDVDELVKAHRRMVQLWGEKRKLEEEKGQVALLMAEIKKAKNPANDKSKDILISQGKSIKEKLKKITQEWWAADEEVTLAALALPNDLHPSTPEEDIQVMKQAFTEREIGPSASHVDIAKKFNLMKFSNVGPGSFYLMGDLARLELSLTDLVSCTLADLSFSQVTCPEMFHTAIVEGCGLDATDPSQVYTLQSRVSEKEADVLQQHMDRLHLRGASLLSFAAYLARMRIEPKSLPLKLFSTGRQYRPVPTEAVKEKEHLLTWEVFWQSNLRTMVTGLNRRKDLNAVPDKRIQYKVTL